MGMQTLYGSGGIRVTDDRSVYVAKHGAIEVPDHLVPRVLALGFTRHRIPTVGELAAESAPVPTVAVVESPVPAAHPQAEIAAQVEAKNVVADEARAKELAKEGATVATAAVPPTTLPVPAAMPRQHNRR